jgi:hypothetical protein
MLFMSWQGNWLNQLCSYPGGVLVLVYGIYLEYRV